MKKKKKGKKKGTQSNDNILNDYSRNDDYSRLKQRAVLRLPKKKKMDIQSNTATTKFTGSVKNFVEAEIR